MWNITDLLPDESCVDLTFPDNMLAGLEGLNCHTDTMCSQTVRVFCIQSRRIDHKHGKILSDCQTRDSGLDQIFMAMHGRKFTKQPVLYIVTSVVKKSILIS